MIELPKDYINQIEKEMDCARELFESYDSPAIKSLRINRRKNKKGILNDGDTIGKAAQRGDIVEWEKAGVYYYDDSATENTELKRLADSETATKSAPPEEVNRRVSYKNCPGKSPLHAAGAYYIQEASAMLPVAELFFINTPFLINENIQNKKNSSTSEHVLEEENLIKAGFSIKKDLSNKEDLLINDIYKIERAEKILDLCAAPGGKSTQIADYMDGKGLLVVNEIVPSRAKILSENIERMGVVNALVINEDPLRLQNRFPAFFDRILVDAPCSGEGMFRKNPEAAKEWSLENVQVCASRQDMILDCAALMLAPGGIITYSTCTFNKSEDEGSVERFIDRHPEFEIVSMRRIFPHLRRGEGHFSSVLRRKDNTVIYSGTKPSINVCEDESLLHSDQEAKDIYDENIVTGKSASLYANLDNEQANRYIKTKSNKSKKYKEEKYKGAKSGKKQNNSQLREAVEAFLDFARDNLLSCSFLEISEGDDFAKGLNDNIMDRLILFGDRLFLTPEYMPVLDGLKVLRPGLHLGNLVKGRFEPSHALALSLKADEATYTVNFAEDSSEIDGYLRGMTICHEGEKGWYLITVEGLSLGWGKLAGGVIKNHYPKGLRIQGGL